METTSIKSLSNGIFSIAMTLLILELHVPALGANHDAAVLTTKLLTLWPKFLCCAISFVALGVLGTFYHRQFSFMAVCDGPAVWLNVLFSMRYSVYVLKVLSHTAPE